MARMELPELAQQMRATPHSALHQLHGCRRLLELLSQNTVVPAGAQVSVDINIYLYLNIYLYRSICQPICLSVSIYLSTHMSTYLSIGFPLNPIYLSIYLSIYRYTVDYLSAPAARLSPATRASLAEHRGPGGSTDISRYK